MSDDAPPTLAALCAEEARAIALEISGVSGGKRRVSFYVACLLVAKALEDDCPALKASRLAVFDADADAVAVAMAQRMEVAN